MEQLTTAIISLVVALITGVVGSGFVSYLINRVATLQKTVDSLHDKLNEQADKFRAIADSCPITQMPCPLRKLFSPQSNKDNAPPAP